MKNKTFTTSCFIRKNTPELRAKLVKMGHTICQCCEFDNADWLTVSCNPDLYRSVHGVGYTDETYRQTQEEIFNDFLTTTKFIDCGENEELFLALAALRTDNPNYQWFLWEHNDGEYHPEDNDSWRQYIPGEHWQEWWWFEVRKATANEIIQHFKNENERNTSN